MTVVAKVHRNDENRSLYSIVELYILIVVVSFNTKAKVRTPAMIAARRIKLINNKSLHINEQAQ